MGRDGGAVGQLLLSLTVYLAAVINVTRCARLAGVPAVCVRAFGGEDVADGAACVCTALACISNGAVIRCSSLRVHNENGSA